MGNRLDIRSGGAGYTLIELVVVISLISIMLAFAAPRLHRAAFSDDTTVVTRWIMTKVPDLKKQAVREKLRYTLHVGIAANTLWVSHQSMPEEELEAAEKNGFKLPGRVRLMDVEYPDARKLSGEIADIHFYRKGYSQKALIHIEGDGGRRLSFFIEPFLASVKVVDGYVGFEG